jgi:transcriptional regulator with XRE-family HTH domain
MKKKMSPGEFAKARKALGLTQTEFARVFHVSPRAVGGWEQGARNGRTHAIPPVVALLVRAAIKHEIIRLELGIKS